MIRNSCEFTDEEKRVVCSIARKRSGYLQDVDDLESIGFLAVLEARDEYDASYQNECPSYIAFMSSKVKHRIIDEIRRANGRKAGDHCRGGYRNKMNSSTISWDPHVLGDAIGSGYKHDFDELELDIIVEGFDDRERFIIDGLRRGERKQDIAIGLGVSAGRVSQLLRGIGERLERELAA